MLSLSLIRAWLTLVLFRVHLHVAPWAEGDQITADQGKIRPVLKVLDVMDRVRLGDATIALAPLAAVTVAPQDQLALVQPLGAAIELIYFHSLII